MVFLKSSLHNFDSNTIFVKLSVTKESLFLQGIISLAIKSVLFSAILLEDI